MCLGRAFGYLKPSSDMKFVNLVVLPYNWEQLESVRRELFDVHKKRPTTEWNKRFENYLQSTPCYYYEPLRHVIEARWGLTVSKLIPPMTLPPVFARLKDLRNETKELKIKELEKLSKVMNETKEEQNNTKTNSSKSHSAAKGQTIALKATIKTTPFSSSSMTSLSSLRDGRISLHKDTAHSSVALKKQQGDSTTVNMDNEDLFLSRENIKESLNDLQSLLSQAALGIIATERTDMQRFKQSVADMQHIDNYSKSNTLRDRNGTFGSPYRMFRRGSDQKDDVRNEKMDDNIVNIEAVAEPSGTTRKYTSSSGRRAQRPSSPIAMAQNQQQQQNGDVGDVVAVDNENRTILTTTSTSTPNNTKKAKTTTTKEEVSLDAIREKFNVALNDSKSDEEIIDIVSSVSKTTNTRDERIGAMMSLFNSATKQGKSAVAQHIMQCIATNHF
eukprot:m.149453 g.149453  ORF g.149453 m.149453 type:complete len:444 (-) comp13270_c2_seq35:1055-2386(-)